MKKTLIFLLILSSFVYLTAQETKSAPEEPKTTDQAANEPADTANPDTKEDTPVSIYGGFGIWYDAKPFVTIVPVLEAIFNIRGGGYAGLQLNTSEVMKMGMEAGVLAFTISDGVTGELLGFIFDVPMRVSAILDLDMFRIYGFGGYCLEASAFVTGTPVIKFNPEAGVRLHLGGLMAEASYVFGSDPFWRFGLGIDFVIDSFDDIKLNLNAPGPGQ
jgi:hypothetical protein